MQVVEEPFDDVAGENRYVGVVFRFIFGDREFKARQYDNQPGEAHFLGYAIDGGRTRGLFEEEIPYRDEDFRQAAYYLRDTVGADNVDILLRGDYRRLDFSQFPGSDKGDSQGEIIHCFHCRAPIPEGQNRCPKCGWSWE
jgi:hypothetical protein